MMQFLRKHQKIVFIVTTGFISIAFVFLGTFSSLFSNSQKVSKDVEFTRLIDGSSLKTAQLLKMIQFLSSSSQNRSLQGQAAALNLLNNGVVEKDFLSTGLGEQLFEYFNFECGREIESKWNNAKGFSSYVHPKDSSISTESIWKSFDPEMSSIINKLHDAKLKPQQEMFSVLSQAFIKQQSIPIELIRKILMQQEHQNKNLEQDPRLVYADLSVCGFSRLIDAIGSKYLELVAQFILNTARFAKQKGYSVPTQQVRQDLMANLASALQDPSDNKLSSEELKARFYQQVAMLGMDEPGVLDLWRSVMLFRKLMSDSAKIIGLDPGIIDARRTLSNKIASVDLYELPANLQKLDFVSLLKMQVYIDSVYPLKLRGDLLALPKTTSPIADIEKRVPELVQKKYLVEYSEVRREDLLSQISLKQVWHWQMRDEHWEKIKKAFPYLSLDKSLSQNDRFAVLESLSNVQRAEIDLFAQNAILNETQDLIKQALQKRQKKTKEWKLSLKMKNSPFVFDDHGPLMNYLDKAPLPSDKQPPVEAIVAQKVLECYSPDQQNYYCIKLISRDDRKKVIPFNEALTTGILDPLLYKRLEAVYPEARKKDPSTYQTSKGIKSIHEVQESLARYAFADVLRAIEKQYAREFKTEDVSNKQLDSSFYVKYRFLNFLKEAQAAVKSDPENPNWVSLNDRQYYQRDFEKQWLLIKTQKQISKIDVPFCPTQDLWSMELDSWSPVITMNQGSLAFFHMIQRDQRKEVPPSIEEQIQEWVRSDAQERLVADLLIKMTEKKAVRFIDDEARGL